MTARLLLVDDHPLFLDGVRAALTGADDLEVVGEAHDVRGAVAAAAELRATDPSVRVLVVTMSADDEAVVAAMRAGARGFVVKGAGRADLLGAIRTVAAGGAVFGPGIADRLGAYFASLASLPGRDAFPQLTEREREVLDLLARGHDNRRIARELFLSEKTVRNHVSNVLTKLEVAGRTEAAVRARNAGLGG